MGFRRLVASAVLFQLVCGAPAAPSAVAATPPTGSGWPGGNARAGQAKAALCGACHGADGNASDPQYPRLAGQQASYIVHQLEAFKTGRRVNPIMMGFAATLSEQDMRDVGAWFASQKAQPGKTDARLAAAGEKLYRQGERTQGVPACMACHGMDGRGNTGALYPQLAGQHASYLEARLKAWHAPSPNAPPSAQLMRSIATRLSDSQITAVASYIEGLNSSAAVSSPPASAP